MKVKSRGTRYRVPISFEGSVARCKQNFKDECDINNILSKYQTTGAISHFAKFAPTYGDVTPFELSDAMQTVITAENMFAELPSTVRRRFGEDPAQFLEFVQDEANAEEMVSLGLRNSSVPSGDAVEAPAALQPPAPASVTPPVDPPG